MLAPQYLLADPAFSPPDSAPPHDPHFVALPELLPAFDPSAGPVVKMQPVHRLVWPFVWQWVVTPFLVGVIGLFAWLVASFGRDVAAVTTTLADLL